MMPVDNPLLQQAVLLHQQNRLAEAYLLYQQVLTKDPRSAVALHHVGILDLLANRLDTARSRLMAAVEVLPADGGPHFHLGEVARRQGRLDDAVADYRRAIQLSPGLLVSYQALGDVLIQQGKPTEAIQPLSILVQVAPQLSGAWMLLGRAF